MSAYENDDQVRPDGQGGFVVRGDPCDRRVIFSDALGWCVYEGPDMRMLAYGRATSDEAIRTLIGDPQ